MTERPLSSLIITTPGVNGGVPRCAEGGVSVRQIAVYHNDGESVEGILAAFTHLKPEEVYAALAYYYANREEVDANLAEEARAFEEVKRLYPRA